MCATNGAGFLRRCSQGNHSSTSACTLVTCLLAGIAVVLAVLGITIFIKKRRLHCAQAAEAEAMAAGGKLFAKKGSWNVKSFRMLAFDEREIVGGVRDENLIGSGGSSNVYRVKLGNGAVVAVKHITRTRAAASGATAAMLEEAGRVPARPCTVGEAAAAEHSGEGAATQGGRRFREVSGVSSRDAGGIDGRGQHLRQGSIGGVVTIAEHRAEVSLH
jgi:hypothetical protein